MSFLYTEGEERRTLRSNPHLSTDLMDMSTHKHSLYIRSLCYKSARGTREGITYIEDSARCVMRAVY